MTESPTKNMRPLEMHSPNAFNIDQDNGIASSPKNSPMKSSPMKSTPSSAPRMPFAENGDDDDENRSRECRRGGNDSFRPSPIGRMDFSTPNNNMNMNVSDTPNHGVGNASFLAAVARDDTRLSGGNNLMDSSFPDNRDDIEIHSPGAALEEEEVQETEEETEEERMQREIEESEALARQLMAEEAMASYAMSTDFLRDNADQFSSEDLAALQAAMAEEDPDADHHHEEVNVDEDVEGYDESQEMSYDALLALGEQIGDVKEERWALIAREKMNQLPTLAWVPSMAEGKEENHTEVKCQVCQFPYEAGDVLRKLPCNHCFHKDCVDSWLETKDTCAFCRKSIVPER